MNSDNRNLIKDILSALEQSLRSLDQWQDISPPSSALASEMPFCYDTLEFNEWLQWVFIPGINHILDNDKALPDASAIYEYAEEIYKNIEIDARELLQLIKSFDQLIYDLSQKNEISRF